MFATTYEQLDTEVVAWATVNGYRGRIVSLDLESKVMDGKFLTGETLLSACVSRRVDKVETDVLMLQEESVQGEIELLNRLDELVLKIRPVIVVGFNHRSYDNILLSMKKRLQSGPGLWGIKDMLERAYMLDLMHASRFAVANHDNARPKMLSLAKVIEHPMFAHLQLMRSKGALIDGTDKGVQIYNLWKSDKNQFRKYAAGDSHDALLIFEEIFRLNGIRS